VNKNFKKSQLLSYLSLPGHDLIPWNMTDSEALSSGFRDASQKLNGSFFIFVCSPTGKVSESHLCSKVTGISLWSLGLNVTIWKRFGEK